MPEALGAVVRKLLAKTPDDRYQSCAGLQADLERCLSEWRRLVISDNYWNIKMLAFEFGQSRTALSSSNSNKRSSIALSNGVPNPMQNGTFAVVLLSGQPGPHGYPCNETPCTRRNVFKGGAS